MGISQASNGDCGTKNYGQQVERSVPPINSAQRAFHDPVVLRKCNKFGLNSKTRFHNANWIRGVSLF
jgi:hypothetical protein